MPTYTLPTIDGDAGQNAGFSVGTNGAAPFVQIDTDGVDVITMPDGNTGLSLISSDAGASIHLFSVNADVGRWYVKSLTGNWAIL